MRSGGHIVKRLASGNSIWHSLGVTKDADDKGRAKAERLSEALRANLRRRKAAAKNNQNKSEKPAKP